MKWWGLLILFLVSTSAVNAQTRDNRIKMWVIKGMATVPDSLIIDPSTIKILNTDSEDIQEFNYDPVTRTIVFNNEEDNQADSIEIEFRILNIPVTRLNGRTLDEYDSAAPFKDYGRSLIPITDTKQQLFETGNVSTAGRLSRGVTIGNTRDLLVNSSLNLTLDGQLSDDLFIRASITDQNIPYQPEGNTAQLQDFDNVFMQLYNDKFSITAGDVVLRNSPSRFLRYYKNVQGALLQSENQKSIVQIGASMAKGKFASVNVTPIDGVSGPYRIPGPDGQDFVIVLANSEKVYLDGKLLTRGFNSDYTIDYNLGELTFTSRIMITEYSRVRIDYEYADNRYDRSIISAGYERKFRNGEVYVKAYSEKDNLNRSNMDLSDEDIEKLILAGDDPLAAITSGADSIGFNSERILYRKTEMNGEEVFVYSTHTDSAHYEVTFTKTGENKGNYVLASTTANGRVYEWIEPVDNQPQGEYVPYQVIPAASKKQMVVIGANYSVTEHENVTIETSFSENDKNLFSTLDSYDDNGKAINLNVHSQDRPIGGSGYTFIGSGTLEYLDKFFSPIDRFRPIEFDRDWTYDPVLSGEDENDIFLDLNLKVEKDNYNKVGYGISRRSKGDLIDGYQQNIVLNKELGNFRLISDVFLLNNSQKSYTSDWIRYHGDISYKVANLRPGYVFNRNRNTISEGDSIRGSANYFDEHYFYLRTEKEDKSSIFDLGFSLREDLVPVQGSMTRNSLAKSLNLSINQQITEGQNLNLTFIYRDVEFGEHQNSNQNGTSINGRLDWSGSFFGNIISNELTYTLSNSRELRKEFIFIQVPTGEGNYHWIDGNEDGIKDLNEFFLAIHFDEKNYAKIFIPTSDYIDAFENTFNYRFNLRFPLSWKKEEGIKGLLYRISNTTIWTSNTKIQDSSLSSRLWAFAKPLSRMEVLTLSENFRTTWFFNRSNPRYGLNFSYKLNHFVNLLTGGVEEKKIDGVDLSGRVNLSRMYTLKLNGNFQKEYSLSELLEDRDFIIQSRKLKPSFSWQPQNNLRLGINYEYVKRQNLKEGDAGEYSNIHELGTEIRWSKVRKMTLQGELKFADVIFSGVESSPSGYALLAGYRPGSNMNWILTIQQTLIEGLQLSINYNGRKSENSRTIHVGRVMVSALF